MLKYETGPFKKPAGMLLAVPSKRVTPKSKFLRKIERAVRDNIAFEQKVQAANRARFEDVLARQAGYAGKSQLNEALDRARAEEDAVRISLASWEDDYSDPEYVV